MRFLALILISTALASCTGEANAEADLLSEFKAVCLAGEMSRDRLQARAREQGWSPLVQNEPRTSPEWQIGYRLPNGGRLIMSGLSQRTVDRKASLPGGDVGNAYREPQQACGIAWATSEDPTDAVEEIAASLGLSPFRFGPPPGTVASAPQLQAWGRPDGRLITASYDPATATAVVETSVQLPASGPYTEQR